MQFRDRWPADRNKREQDPWLADINVGSIHVESYRKRDGSTAAVLKGRLLNIRALKIGKDVVHGELPEALPQPIFVAPCYINEIKPDKKTMKIAALDGKVDEPESFGVNLDYGDNGSIAELLAMGICPKGYANRDTNPKVFAVLEIGGLEAAVYKDNAYAKGTLQGYPLPESRWRSYRRRQESSSRVINLPPFGEFIDPPAREHPVWGVPVFFL